MVNLTEFFLLTFIWVFLTFDFVILVSFWNTLPTYFYDPWQMLFGDLFKLKLELLTNKMYFMIKKWLRQTNVPARCSRDQLRPRCQRLDHVSRLSSPQKRFGRSNQSRRKTGLCYLEIIRCLFRKQKDLTIFLKPKPLPQFIISCPYPLICQLKSNT